MGLDSFNTDDEDNFEVDQSGEQVRPYAHEATHEAARDFAKDLAVSITDAYDIIIQTAVYDDEIATRIVELARSNGHKMTPFKMKLLNDLADKVEEVGEFPTRTQVNEDSNMYSFALYIDALGTKERIKDLLEDNREDITEYL